jgi:hypothetical protein
MGARSMKLKAIALLTALFFGLSLTSAVAATKSPTPTPKASVTKKAPVKKAPVKKPPVKKKNVKLSPSPSPKWPPVGFKTDPLGETKLYLKVPTAKELVGILSAKSTLASQIKDCTKFTCGAVIVASETGCRWWKVTGDVVGATSAEDRKLKTFGTISTSVTRSAAKQIVTILMVTTEPIGLGHIVTNINADCNQSEPSGPMPNTEYKATEG